MAVDHLDFTSQYVISLGCSYFLLVVLCNALVFTLQMCLIDFTYVMDDECLCVSVLLDHILGILWAEFITF